MALANYTDLVSSVKSWLHRADMDNVIPDLISLAESRISLDLKIQSLEKSYTITTVGGQQAYAMPSDIVSLTRMYVTDPSGNIGLVQGYDPTTYRYNNAPQMPRYYFIEQDMVNFTPVPDGAYDVTMVYKGAVPSLEANSTNTVMTKYPNIYLFGTLAQAAPYIKEDERIQLWEQKYAQAIKDANMAEDYRDHSLLVTEAANLLPRRSYDIRIM